MIKKFQLKKILENKQLFKVISGMENFNSDNIKMVVNAAGLGAAQAVDISADSENIRWVKENFTNMIVFVSSLSPAVLVKSMEWGADVLELGNFDAMYAQGREISNEEVISMTRELRSMAGKNAVICITVPGKSSVEEQVDMAIQLQAAGADILQVENLSSDSDYANASAITKAVEIPVILSGRLDHSKVEKAMATGVNGIGIGHAVNSKEVLPEMVEEVKAVMTSINKSAVAV